MGKPQRRDWTPNPGGNPESIVAHKFKPGNQAHLKHGVYSSRRELPAEAEALGARLLPRLLPPPQEVILKRALRHRRPFASFRT